MKVKFLLIMFAPGGPELGGCRPGLGREVVHRHCAVKEATKQFVKLGVRLGARAAEQLLPNPPDQVRVRTKLLKEG